VAAGDTLWDIAQQTFGNLLRWGEIYTLNQQLIESAARRNGYAEATTVMGSSPEPACHCQG
jgi:nucleoid-associated protein YgaU